MNEAAMRLLDGAAPRAPSEEQATWSRRALKVLLARAGGRFRIDHESWVTVSNEGRPPLVLHAVPVAEMEESGPNTILVMIDLGHRPKPGSGVLHRLFDLTPAEAKLAIEIGCGKSLNEVAHDSGLSNATLRTQLSAVFNKTQIRRQSELVALLSRVAILP